ncbi:lipoprotein [Vibrio sp. JCM 19236]|nr:lipoprotein [Vibrio sp. JCM 19236]
MTDFSYTFAEASQFNTDLSLWDTSKATTFYYMFEDATSFEFNITDWDVTKVEDMRGMFEGVTIPTETYDQILINWSEQEVQDNVVFNAGNSQYSIDAQAARDKLITDYGWSITDAGLAP